MAELLNITIGTLLDNVSNKFPDNDAVVYPDRGLKLSYHAFNQEVGGLAKAFMQLGVEKGDHIAIWASNKPEWLTCQFATGRMGAVLITVNTNYRTTELEYLLKQSDASVIILMEEYRGASYIGMLYDILPELKTLKPGEKLNSKTLPQLKHVIMLGEKPFPGTMLFSDLLACKDEVSD